MKKSKVKLFLTTIVLLAVVGAVGYGLYTQKFKADDGSQELSLFTVEQGPLTISVLEAGTIKARDVEVIKSEVEGKTTVLWVIEEATQVKKGDKLIELDASALNDSNDLQTITVLSAKTAADIAEVTLDVVISKAQSDVEQAEQVLRFAIMDKEKYLGKEDTEEHTQDANNAARIKEIKTLIPIAKKEVLRTSEKLNATIKLIAEKHIAASQRLRNEIASNEALFNLTLLESELYLLNPITAEPAQQDSISASTDKESSKGNAEEAEYATQLKDINAKIEIANKEVLRTKKKLVGSEKLFEEKYISETERASDEISWKKSQLDLTLQQSQRYLLINYTHPRTCEALNSDVKQAKSALKRAIRKAGADVFEAKQQLKTTTDKHLRQKDILDKIQQQISNTVILAPNDGRVIYASSTKASWRGNDEPLSEGETVHEREELFHLPKADLVSVVANVHEANLDKVKIGSPVSIKVDAVPGEIFTGVVGKIAVMPDARMVWINPNLKVYKTEMFIDDKTGNPGGKLRTGMGCQAEVVTAHYDDVVYVPIQAVITVDDHPTVYVFENGKTNPRKVEIGKDNNRMIHIISGLVKGEKVLLTPPLSKAEVKGNGKRGKGKPGQRPGSKPDGMGKPVGGKPQAAEPAKQGGRGNGGGGGGRPRQGAGGGAGKRPGN